jgi:hypothetical protein
VQREDTVRHEKVRIWMTALLAVCLFAAVAAPAKAALRMLSYTGTLTWQVGALPSATGSGGAVAPAVTYGGHLSTLAIPGVPSAYLDLAATDVRATSCSALHGIHPAHIRISGAPCGRAMGVGAW